VTDALTLLVVLAIAFGLPWSLASLAATKGDLER